MAGQIVDASLIAAPRQRNTQDEKKAIKDGRIPDDWKDKPAKLRQKDRDARWTVKYIEGQAARGWIDAARRSGDSGLRRSEPHLARSRFRLHSQMERDGRRSLDEGPLSAPSTSRQDQHGEQRLGGHRLAFGRRREFMERNGFVSHVHRKRPKGARCRKRSGAPTTPNRKSVRASSRILPSKGTGWVCSSGPSGSARAKTKIGLANLVYNIERLLFLRRIAAA